MFSKACEYSIRASICVMHDTLRGNRVSPKQIAEKIASPESFTAKLLQNLSRSGVIDSRKGPNGGFEINSNKIDSLKLLDVVLAVDGDSILHSCGIGLRSCNNANPCPVHYTYRDIRIKIVYMLQNTSIKELAVKLENNQAFLKVDPNDSIVQSMNNDSLFNA